MSPLPRNLLIPWRKSSREPSATSRERKVMQKRRPEMPKNDTTRRPISETVIPHQPGTGVPSKDKKEWYTTWTTLPH